MMTIKKSIAAAVATVAVAAGLGVAVRHDVDVAHAAPAGAPGSAPEQVLTNTNIADVAERVVASVVGIASTRKIEGGVVEFDPFFTNPFSPFFGGEPDTRQQAAMGSGVIVSDKGRILTNAHVVRDADEIKVTTWDGTELDAKVVGVDSRSDVAVLQVEGDLPALRPIVFGDSNKLRLGEVVLAIGNPFGVGQSVTMGIVSAKGRATGGTDYQDFIQTDAAINPGNSGGALVNLQGELVGINTAIISRTGGYQGIGFAIPSAMARPIMDMLIKDGKVSRGYMGVNIQTINKTLAKEAKLDVQHGVLVSQVDPKSPAGKAGLKDKDVVIALDGADIRDANKLRNEVAMRGAGKTAELTILRGKDKKTIKVTLGELPDPDTVKRPRAQPRVYRKVIPFEP
jgi:Do/DeqQ family serine protease